uniref:Thiamin pyrophosphokinase thiamin-binding domain-containing protein n=1 Tax=Pristhesancus plagipennis TaxID=1955184 RepID=A0A2K8JX53_PRIPG|nr:secreted hypothetical protein [Pristhesancus plagipennis]
MWAIRNIVCLLLVLFVLHLSSSTKMAKFSWSPLDLKEPFKLNLKNYAVLILNRPISLPSKLMESLWNGASVRSTVDGGTTTWFDYVKKHDLKLNNKYPDIISGDFDSISPELLKTCEENGVYVEKTPDQDYTDFEKAIWVIKRHYAKQLDSLIAVIDNADRLDHTFSNLNTLYRVRQSIFPETNTTAFILSSVSLTWMLEPGQHSVSIPNYLSKQQVWCGILPFKPVKNHITTTGLKWNLENNSVEFGGLISSSNTYDGSNEVTINTDAEILWSMGLVTDK